MEVKTDLDLGLNVDVTESLEPDPGVQKGKRKFNVQWCSAINCKKNRYSNKDMSFFRFPKDEERCKKWVTNTRRKDLLGKTAKQLFSGNVLCADHFENSQFATVKRNRLKPLKAIPTLFDVPNPPPKITPESPERPKIKIKKPAKPDHNENQNKRIRLYRQKLVALRKVVNAQRKRLQRLHSKHEKTSLSTRAEIELLKTLSKKYLNADLHSFFCRQLDMSVKKGRWEARDKSYALSLYQTSPKTYELLRRQFILPSIGTLRRAMKNVEDSIEKIQPEGGKISA